MARHYETVFPFEGCPTSTCVRPHNSEGSGKSMFIGIIHIPVQKIARGKPDHVLGSNKNALACRRVYAGPGILMDHAPRAETLQRDLVSFFQCRGNVQNEGFQHHVGLLFGHPGLFNDVMGENCSVHDSVLYTFFASFTLILPKRYEYNNIMGHGILSPYIPISISICDVRISKGIERFTD